MANRAALLLSAATEPSDADARVTHSHRYGAALFWYAGFDEGDVQAMGPGGWEARWHALLVDEPDDAAVAATVLWTAWPKAKARLDAVVTRLQALPPALRPDWFDSFLTWRTGLEAVAEAMSARWLGLELVQIFAFHEDPAEMSRSTLDAIRPWRGEGVIQLETDADPEALTGHIEPGPMRAAPGGWLPGAAASPGRLRRPELRDWALLGSFGVILAGTWTSTGSAWLTILTAAFLAVGFVLILRQPR